MEKNIIAYLIMVGYVPEIEIVQNICWEISPVSSYKRERTIFVGTGILKILSLKFIYCSMSAKEHRLHN